ncbi:hypothetical protein L484_025696 [Morus notabilis]|uniref:Uncharacterized protein n=1 Tax=Morus notabilis TaxID=981085 RepID=W9R3V1_9ROSA|nr:hypothetical protein L484_025696 [Morus notabilis]
MHAVGTTVNQPPWLETSVTKGDEMGLDLSDDGISPIWVANRNLCSVFRRNLRRVLRRKAERIDESLDRQPFETVETCVTCALEALQQSQPNKADALFTSIGVEGRTRYQNYQLDENKNQGSISALKYYSEIHSRRGIFGIGVDNHPRSLIVRLEGGESEKQESANRNDGLGVREKTIQIASLNNHFQSRLQWKRRRYELVSIGASLVQY